MQFVLVWIIFPWFSQNYENNQILSGSQMIFRKNYIWVLAEDFREDCVSFSISRIFHAFSFNELEKKNLKLSAMLEFKAIFYVKKTMITLDEKRFQTTWRRLIAEINSILLTESKILDNLGPVQCHRWNELSRPGRELLFYTLKISPTSSRESCQRSQPKTTACTQNRQFARQKFLKRKLIRPWTRCLKMQIRSKRKKKIWKLVATSTGQFCHSEKLACLNNDFADQVNNPPPPPKSNWGGLRSLG